MNTSQTENAAFQPHPELVIFIGPQAAGKSTFYRTRFAKTHVLVSKDRLRNHRRPGKRQRDLIAAALSSGQHVVVDNTNPTAAVRRELIDLGHDHGARIVGYFFAATLSKVLARNRLRTGRARVPDFAVTATYRRLERPSLDEGFHELRLVKALFDEMFFEAQWEPELMCAP